MDSLASQVIVDILKTEMVLDSQAIWLREQNKVIPNDQKMYIAVGLVSAHTLSNITELKKISDAVEVEVNHVQQKEAIQIDIFSYDNEALLRNWEVIAALQSFYSQRRQEENNFKIFRIPQSFLDTSATEGGSTLKKYSITINCLVWYRKQKSGDYFDSFRTRVDDEATIGTDDPMAEFEINQGGIVP